MRTPLFSLSLSLALVPAAVMSNPAPATQPAATQPAATQPAATQPAATQPAATQPAATRPATAAVIASPPVLRLERTRLDNGLQGLLLCNPSMPMVGVFAVIRAGLRDELPGEDGLSHFLEHLLFNGTESLAQSELYAAVDRLGGYSNATTRRDHTVFQMLVPSEHLERALAIHADMLFRSTLPPASYEKERGIVLEEMAKDDADPANAIDAAFESFAWQGTPLARPVIGSPETIRSIARDRVLAYWRRRYVPASVTVLVVGNATPERFEAALRQAYGNVEASGGCQPDNPIRPRFENRSVRSMRQVGARLELRLAIAGPPPGHPDTWALDVIAALLADGAPGALERSLLAAGHAGAKGQAELDRVAGSTMFLVRASAAPDTDPDAFLHSVVSTIATVASATSDDDLQSTATGLAAADAFLAEKPHYFGLEKGALLVNDGPGAVEVASAARAAVSLSGLRSASLRWLVDRPYRALVAGPDLVDGLRTVPGLALPEAALAAREPSRLTRKLGNHLELSIASNPTSGVFAAHVLFRDRALAEHGHPGTADLLHRLLAARGPELEAEISRIGATLKTVDTPSLPFDDYYNVPEYGFLRLETADVLAEPAIWVLGRLLTLPDLSRGAVESARSEQAIVAGRQLGSPSGLSAWLLARALYGGDHPLALPLHGDPASIPGVPELEHLAPTYLAGPSLIVTVESGRPAESLLPLLESALAPLGKTGAAPPPLPPLPGAPSRSESTLGAPQAYVRLGRAFELAPGDEAAAVVAAALYGDRLAADIREQRGMAYSIGAGCTVRPAPWPDAWSATTGTRPENVDEVEQAMLAILRDLVRDGPGEDELQTVAARLAGRELMRRLTSIGRAYFAGVDLWRGEEPGSGLLRVQGLATVRVVEVREALARYFAPDAVSIAVVR